MESKDCLNYLNNVYYQEELMSLYNKYVEEFAVLNKSISTVKNNNPINLPDYELDTELITIYDKNKQNELNKLELEIDNHRIQFYKDVESLKKRWNHIMTEEPKVLILEQIKDKINTLIHSNSYIYIKDTKYSCFIFYSGYYTKYTKGFFMKKANKVHFNLYDTRFILCDPKTNIVLKETEYGYDLVISCDQKKFPKATDIIFRIVKTK